MQNEYTAVVKQEGDWWVGWIEEIPGVNCQEKIYDELKESLEVTLREALEFNRQDALNSAGSGYKEEKNRYSKIAANQTLHLTVSSLHGK